MMRSLALALLVAACVLAQAAPRAASLAQPYARDEEQQRGHGHGMMPWMRRPFTFDAEFEGDGSCEVHRSGDGRGSVKGSERCEKSVHGRMSLERDDDAASAVSARSRDALGAALAAQLGADGDLPAGLVEAAVAGALDGVAPEELSAALQAGGSLEIKAKANFKLDCSIRKQDEQQSDSRDGQDDHGGDFKAELRCKISKDKSGSARCSHRNEDEAVSPDMIQQLRQRTAAYAWRLAHGG